MNSTNNIVEIENLIKRYKDKLALNGFNLKIKKGEILGLLGPNGSGKTTAINCLLGLLKFDSGMINVFGSPLNADSYGKKRKIGVVPQDLVYMKNLTVKENIEFFCGLYETDSKKIKSLVKYAMDFVNIENYQNYFPRKLSGGLKRRLNIACGIAHKPELLILDEPTVAVDAESRNFILNQIKLLRDNGVTILYTTHYMEEVEEIANNIVIIKDGQNIAEGSLSGLLNMIEETEKIKIDLDDSGELQEQFKSLKNLKSVVYKDNFYELSFKNEDNNMKNILNYLDEKNLTYKHIYSERPRLNQVYLELTGKEITE